MRINLERLKSNIKQLAKIGYEEGKGITRLPFTSAYEEGKEFVKSLMQKAGLKVYEDGVGNIFGKLEGKGETSILVGSHIDTVPSGGMFDGSLGVLGGLECIQTLKENNYDNHYTLEVAAFVAEEGTEVGGCFGSRCFAGGIKHENLNKFLEKVGLTSEDVRSSKRDPETIKNYLELHIEQGNVLDTEGISIGIVKGIVGIARYKAEVTGNANHAGTTPMHLRDDALLKASKINIKLNEIVKKLGEPLVGTIGYLEVEPGAVNVIPGKVKFSIELRDMDRQKVKKAIELLKQECADMDLTIEKIEFEWEAYLDENVQSKIEQACKQLGYSYKYMYSGAGHDANPLSSITPTGMIFVPSKDGISHSPKEWTDWNDIEKGCNVLLNTLQLLDKD